MLAWFSQELQQQPGPAAGELREPALVCSQPACAAAAPPGQAGAGAAAALLQGHGRLGGGAAPGAPAQLPAAADVRRAFDSWVKRSDAAGEVSWRQK
jgi:hypothetical protein